MFSILYEKLLECLHYSLYLLSLFKTSFIFNGYKENMYLPLYEMKVICLPPVLFSSVKWSPQLIFFVNSYKYAYNGMLNELGVSRALS